VDLIDKEQWSILSADVKADAYEGLLQKNAEDVKGGAGQYFTPRPLIAAMVDVIAPQPGHAICDPACGNRGSAFTHVHEGGTLWHVNKPLNRGTKGETARKKI
jgi:type I restriction enzyme M protein